MSHIRCSAGRLQCTHDALCIRAFSSASVRGVELVGEMLMNGSVFGGVAEVRLDGSSCSFPLLLSARVMALYAFASSVSDGGRVAWSAMTC